MSEAGIYSNRGDFYQTLIAFDWALTVFHDHNYQWIEIDSTEYDVDDVVIGKTDGSVICCQCKKNQTEFRVWSITNLIDELEKACHLLLKCETAEIRFYSRTPFGDLDKLKERTQLFKTASDYYKNLPKKLKDVDAKLARQITDHGLTLSSYDFLGHITFDITPTFDRLEEQLKERLHCMVNAAESVYTALWYHLEQLGARVMNGISAAESHRLTKENILHIVATAGGIISRLKEPNDIKAGLSTISRVGRSWKRDIAGEYIVRPVFRELLTAIEQKTKSILLTGSPGCGKTCIMLALQQELEERAKIDSSVFPLFIQSREFADLTTEADRADLGLSTDWVEDAARLADAMHVIIVIDSLDVLSIAREHRILTYFLTQLDRLSNIPNTTVITACRDFDRHYDHRIAERKWDKEVVCGHLDWDTEVKPLLEKVQLDLDAIKIETQELIRNPRELALLVELAQRKKDCHVITSQALAQRYLDVVVREDSALGDKAMVAIEEIAHEMLKDRKLSVPHQRVFIPNEFKRQLYSLNIILETQNGDLTFGHQTLFDVLVIGGLLRKGCTLYKFIKDLPPVPFVRPCIRSFLTQLASGNRHEYRKQLRTVLTGNAAFHIRRLVAESLAEQIPQDEDWLLIQELRNNHKEIFQVVYYRSRRPEWFQFWDKYLVPILLAHRDAGGINLHLSKIFIWVNQFSPEVLDFCTKIFLSDYIDRSSLVWEMATLLEKVRGEFLRNATSLVEKLLDLPRIEYSPLGKVIARFVSAGAISDAKLWEYISGEIGDTDIEEYDSLDKLHCQSYEFGNNDNQFLSNRMSQSVDLLELAIASIEKWNNQKTMLVGASVERYCDYFLHMTSYKNIHAHNDNSGHQYSSRIFFDSIENAIIKHAQMQSKWWESNQRRICFHREGALRYFGILACTKCPEKTRSITGCLLTNKEMLESSLSHELGLLIKSSFVYLEVNIQNTIIQTILSLYSTTSDDISNESWVLEKRANLISFIPCYLRSPDAQLVLDIYENRKGKLTPLPDIYSWSGWVRSPFSYDVFLSVSNSSALKLINHYYGYNNKYSDNLIGGEDEVKRELDEAASRQPVRFLNFLSSFWNNIPDGFRDEIMNGIATHISCLHANLHKQNEWTPLEKPNCTVFANQILDELEYHSLYWHHNRAASSAIQACSHVIEDISAAERLTSLCLEYSTYKEENVKDEGDLLQAGMNMISGHIVDALMTLTNNLLEKNLPLPDLLKSTLFRFARSPYKAHQVLILHKLPYLQSKNYELGGALFHEALNEPSRLWTHAERCLYYAYHKHIDEVEPILQQIYLQAQGKELETWGRISALASLTDSQKQNDLLEKLKSKNNPDAWKGAAQVWSHLENIQYNQKQCFFGLEQGLLANPPCAFVVADEISSLFRKNNTHILIPEELLQHCFEILEKDTENKNHALFSFCEWGNVISLQNPKYALTAIEYYLCFITKRNLRVHDYHNNCAQLMTRLFAEAEEQEEIDGGKMLQRVVALQDQLLANGVNGINEWLGAAERP